jgi:hypothetical protein
VEDRPKSQTSCQKSFIQQRGALLYEMFKLMKTRDTPVMLVFPENLPDTKREKLNRDNSWLWETSLARLMRILNDDLYNPRLKFSISSMNNFFLWAGVQSDSDSNFESDMLSQVCEFLSKITITLSWMTASKAMAAIGI